MKNLLLILVFTSVSIAQVDSIYTKSSIYTGEVTQATESDVCIFNATSLKHTIQKKNIKRFVLDGGVVIVGLGIPPARYESYLMDMFPNETDNSVSNIEEMLNKADTLELKKLYSPRFQYSHKISPEERSADALEDIAFVLKVQLGLGIAFIVIALLAF